MLSTFYNIGPNIKHFPKTSQFGCKNIMSILPYNNLVALSTTISYSFCCFKLQELLQENQIAL